MESSAAVTPLAFLFCLGSVGLYTESSFAGITKTLPPWSRALAFQYNGGQGGAIL